MAISSEALRQRLLASLTNRQTPSTIGGAFGDLGSSIATALQLRRDVPNLEAKETADKIGEEVRLRDALAASGIDPGAAGSIASAPAALRGALLGLQETPADRREAAIAADDRTFERTDTLFQQGATTERLANEQRRLILAESPPERAPSQIDTVRMKDGSVRSFRRDDPLLDQALRQGGVRFNANVDAADASGLGGATTASQTRAQQTIDSSEATLGTIQQLREVLRPENVGLSGDIRELGIGALGQLESFSAWVDGKTQVIIDQAIESGDTLDLSLITDPDLSAQRLLENVLTYQYSKAISPGDRVTDQDFRQNFKALGFGKNLTSIGDLLARLDTAEKTIKHRQDIAKRRLEGTSPQGEGTSPRSKVTRKIVFDAQGNEVVP